MLLSASKKLKEEEKKGKTMEKIEKKKEMKNTFAGMAKFLSIVMFISL